MAPALSRCLLQHGRSAIEPVILSSDRYRSRQMYPLEIIYDVMKYRCTEILS